MKIFVAIPASESKLDCNVHAALLEEFKISVGVGDELIVEYFPSSGGIADGRNHLVADFLKSECDKLFFLDSDVSFTPGSLINLANKPVDLVGGCYRYKKEEEEYPIRFKPGHQWTDKNGLLEVEGIPFGFCCISREVFKRFDEKFPERVDKNFGFKSNVYFHLPFVDGIFWGEDYMFCKEWREMGGKVYLAPDIDLIHWSFKPVPYRGNIFKWLKSRVTEDQEKMALNTKKGILPEIKNIGVIS